MIKIKKISCISGLVLEYGPIFDSICEAEKEVNKRNKSLVKQYGPTIMYFEGWVAE